ncbi:hypothetical protein BV25DRAFT_1640618 [Artomyces pyxidatus]|uniref:Uncharacterized protein n=1 Tax=Artomyces pyxidatus TaxID=48021 RepID=A0ACB8SK11_9AGAM|nr:hypothetical protein BV25DRAFT_1640618 [Artomyces pyxidatus]
MEGCVLSQSTVNWRKRIPQVVIWALQSDGRWRMGPTSAAGLFRIVMSNVGSGWRLIFTSFQELFCGMQDALAGMPESTSSASSSHRRLFRKVIDGSTSKASFIETSVSTTSSDRVPFPQSSDTDRLRPCDGVQKQSVHSRRRAQCSDLWRRSVTSDSRLIIGCRGPYPS